MGARQPKRRSGAGISVEQELAVARLERQLVEIDLLRHVAVLIHRLDDRTRIEPAAPRHGERPFAGDDVAAAVAILRLGAAEDREKGRRAGGGGEDKRDDTAHGGFLRGRSATVSAGPKAALWPSFVNNRYSYAWFPRFRFMANAAFPPADNHARRMRKTCSSFVVSWPSRRSPVSLSRLGMSRVESGSVHSTIRCCPGRACRKALRVRNAGSGHLRPRKSSRTGGVVSSLIMVSCAALRVEAGRSKNVRRVALTEARTAFLARIGPVAMTGMATAKAAGLVLAADVLAPAPL